MISLQSLFMMCQNKIVSFQKEIMYNINNTEGEMYVLEDIHLNIQKNYKQCPHNMFLLKKQA